MARYEHLPIYKSVYDLNLYFFKLARGFAKEYKYGLAQEITQLLTKLFDTIVEANNMNDKVVTLKAGLVIVERLKFKARLLHDLNVMSLKSNQYFSMQLVDISRQFEKWLSWSQTHITLPAEKGIARAG